jgi:hypothetical protein
MNWGHTYAAGSLPVPFGARQSTYCSGEGDGPAPPFPPDGERTDRRAARRGWTHASLAAVPPSLTSREGHRLADVHHLLTARMETAPVATVDGEAHRTWSIARFLGDRRDRARKDRMGTPSRAPPGRRLARPLTAASCTSWPPVAGASLSLGEHGPASKWRRGSAAPVAAALSLTEKKWSGVRGVRKRARVWTRSPC